MNEVSVVERQAVAAVSVTPMALLQIAMNQGADLQKLEKLMELQERWEANEARKAFNEAFAAFKAEAVNVLKNKMVTAGPLSGKSYAELHSVVDAVTPALSRHGLSTSWKLTKDEPGWLEVTCTLKHVKGHSESVSIGGPPDEGGAKSKIQARASTITYLERYTLKAVCGVSEKGDDTDGNGRREVEPDAEGKAKLEACGSLDSLQAAWKGLTLQQRETLGPTKDACKKRIQDADREAA